MGGCNRIGDRQRFDMQISYKVKRDLNSHESVMILLWRPQSRKSMLMMENCITNEYMCFPARFGGDITTLFRVPLDISREYLFIQWVDEDESR